MSANRQSEKAWRGWFEIMRQVVSLLHGGDLGKALSRLDGFLSQTADPELRSDALGMRAEVNRRLGSIERAIDDLLVARSLTGPDYRRYVHELSLGALFESQNLQEQATSWYRAALNTCLLDKGTSGGTALKRLLDLSPPTSLSPDDIDLCRKVVEHSWRVLRLPGDPGLLDLASAVSIIGEAQGRLVRPRNENPHGG